MWSHNKGVVGGITSRLRAINHDKCLLVTVKEWLKSVLNYRSYPKNKTGNPFFGPPCISNATKGRAVSRQPAIFCCRYSMAQFVNKKQGVCVFYLSDKDCTVSAW